MQLQQNRMSRSEFETEMCRQMLALLGDGYDTEVSTVRKNNGVLKAVLYIRKESSECIPCFYTEELYRSYCMGENETALAEHLANIVRGECEKVKSHVNEYLSEAWIENHLFLRLVQREKNEAWLQEAVYVSVMDLAAVFYVLTEDTEEGVKSYQLPKHIWDSLDLGTAEAYFPKAVENTRRLFPEEVWSIERNITAWGLLEDVRIVRVPPEHDILPADRLYVLSNHRRINGAAVVLYPELLQRLGEQVSGNFYLIPSSVHEMLLLKETREVDAAFFNRVVREVNEQKVEPEEVLANHVYYYSVETRSLTSREEG